MNTDKRPHPFTALRTALLMAGLAVAMLFSAAPAQAVDDGTLGVRPEKESDFFHLSIHPGSAMDVTAIVTNHKDSPVTLLTYPVDGQSTPQGAFAFASQSDERKTVGGWVKLKSTSITVPAKSEQKVPFRITVPVGTEPGDYAGGLIIQAPPVEGETSMINGDTALRLDIVQRQGVRIYLNVAGEAVKSLGHGDLKWHREGDAVTFTLPIHNTGNVTLHPTVDLDVSEWTGTATKLTFNKPESILPDARLELQATLSEAPPVHVGHAKANVTSEAGEDHVETSIFYVSLMFILITLLVVAALGFIIWRTVRFIRRARQAISQVSQIQSGAAESQTRKSRRMLTQ